MASTICPDTQRLKAFALGDISGSAFETIAEHVADCSACDSLLQNLDSVADGLITELKCLQTGDSPRVETVPHELATTARSALMQDVAIDPGRSFARRLEDGHCRLGKFELEAELGVGSFGYVFRARDTELDRTVAIKIQRAGAFASDEEAGRFLREARSAAQLEHPAIVSLYETGQTGDGVCFLVTEYIEGETMERQLASGRPHERQTAALIAELAEALQYAHDHGVIHRDVKPSNVLIDGKGRPHIMDFGLAKREAGELTVTSDGRVMGTPAYMSPEQARGESHDVDARTDVYSLGVMLYEMLTGERPFQGNRRMLLLQVLEDEPRPPRQLNERTPRDLETICLKAMAKSPARRYQNAQELADDLRRFLQGDPIQARPVGYAERLWRWCRRYPMAAVLLVALCIGSVAGFWYLSALSTYFVRSTALDSARMEAEMLEQINLYYSEDIVARLDRKEKLKNLKVSPDYADMDDALPLPVIFTKDAAKRISESTVGMHVALYSGYPWREDAGAKNPFQQRALQVLQERVDERDPDISYHEFGEEDGRAVLRFAKAQIMQSGCVECHNESKRSPKRDWVEGDLAGVLAITRPLDQDVARTRSGLGGAFILMGSIAASLAGVCVILIVGSRVRRKQWSQSKNARNSSD